MRKTLSIQLLALLAIQILHFIDGKAFEESQAEVSSFEVREKGLVAEELLEKRENEDQEKEAEVEEEDEMEEEEEEVEKREDEDESSESENAEVEDLDARAIQSRFRLVDNRGRRIYVQREGLLLFNGGTVCINLFSMNSAHAICRTMGFSRATRYRSGLVYGKFQSRKQIKLSNVICGSTNWGACRSTHNHNCGHHEDILLTCQGTEFNLISRNGGLVRGRKEGLLTYQHGTVCGDHFDLKAAYSICKVMGYAGAVTWRLGWRYGTEQGHRRITLDDVKCKHYYWNSCTYRTSHNCTHHRDVFLTCQPGGNHPSE